MLLDLAMALGFLAEPLLAFSPLASTLAFLAEAQQVCLLEALQEFLQLAYPYRMRASLVVDPLVCQLL